MIEFVITTEYIELVRLLKAVGAGESGGHLKQAISDGTVTVDGQIETRKKCKIRSGQLVELGDTRVFVKQMESS